MFKLLIYREILRVKISGHSSIEHSVRFGVQASGIEYRMKALFPTLSISVQLGSTRRGIAVVDDLDQITQGIDPATC